METWSNAFQFIGANIKNLNDSINYYNRQLKICRKMVSDLKYQLKKSSSGHPAADIRKIYLC